MDLTTLTCITHNGYDVASWGNRAFEFFSRFGSTNYSAKSLMEIQSLSNYDSDDEVPVVGTLSIISAPFQYDPETEIKKGGSIGMVLTWPTGKSLLVVKNPSRRQGVATKLLNHHMNYIREGYFWVHRNNPVAQSFLLSQGLTPTAMNSSGAIRYGIPSEDEA